jgi:hypothetical protein
MLIWEWGAGTDEMQSFLFTKDHLEWSFIHQASLLLPYVRSQRLEIIFHQFHYELLVAGAPPAIAVDTAGQHVIVVVDPH